MAKPIITLNGLKIVIMLGMLVIILCGIRFCRRDHRAVYSRIIYCCYS
ncbi:transporter [Escherichia coli]|uniref:Transporter n=1 Tax=Escherichia coli TaxID=562 RepID=A0A376TGH1_ECOLX|nr:transporter [Escherichia coli]